MYGWREARLKNGAVVRFKPTFAGLTAKLQRPKSLMNPDLEELDEMCKEMRVIILKFEPGLDQDLKLIKNHNFIKVGTPNLATKTIFIDLRKDQSSLWSDLSSNARNLVRRAKIEGVKITEEKNLVSGLGGFYKILSRTGRKKKFYVQSFEELKRKCEVFNEDSHLMSAYNSEGDLCASQLYLGFNNNIWGFHAGISEKGEKNRSGYKLLWESYLLFKQKGYEIIDLEGIEDDRYPTFTREWRNFSNYKKKFGGEIVTFPETYTKFFSIPFKLLAKAGLSI
ncbi:hypothetical protein A2716_02375 [candidate division WWE3 bacterium RIFCSPHIGHO2_01_FULL_40_23]|uniref:BioF2-like acetyltransferase domain-containing protein n=1 Tax=candidate division WWE3 bacterium RIFCSPLOWO2_01_FULL_41_18 TaxID=1802625 RepID=A0A1F4VEZ5_UNCKA|nr:MAG: hypothetical protein A2716_02375 [candidate division WWE3 bacterium RIFCSPHIGHO2_01_FULL_40_23]OGC55831.1 MAG: hypothetical protein A3A78_02225 [candidate division WWE3 bacterium RIFCSPLOWO2_01_FULL_41_18]